jgi:hypothetical protein
MLLPLTPATIPDQVSVFLLPGNLGFSGAKIFYTTAENKSKEENGYTAWDRFTFFSLCRWSVTGKWSAMRIGKGWIERSVSLNCF